MRVAFVGLGKLGLPVALALEDGGHEVAGWDASQDRRRAVYGRSVPEREQNVPELLRRSSLTLLPVRDLIEWAPDVVMICVQTPHRPELEGAQPLTSAPEDFSYAYLVSAVTEVNQAILETGADPLQVIVSTCLPGTYDREIRPLTVGRRVVYNPLFVAMGTVIHDLRSPEFILVGRDPEVDYSELRSLYGPIMRGAPSFRGMSIVSAELTKVAYNAAIGFKIGLANALGELADRTGANVDDVTSALMCADDRIVSTAYMRAGMGDGGACHPRDQIALSWLADTLAMSHDPFMAIIRNREMHARWLARLWVKEAQTRRLPTIMLGRAFKSNSDLIDGSAARLVEHYARELGVEPRVEEQPFRMPKACYFLATPHDHFLTARPPNGSVVVDPWGLFPVHEDVDLITPGRRDTPHDPSASDDVPARARQSASTG